MRLQHKCFPFKTAKLLRITILKNTCKRPLLKSMECSFFAQIFKISLSCLVFWLKVIFLGITPDPASLVGVISSGQDFGDSFSFSLLG